MAVKVRCSGCQKVLTVPDQARGKAVKCPNCDTKIAVPAGEAAPAKKKAKAAHDSEDALASVDLRHAEDRDARVCFKCGYDMSHLDEETTECPKCGTDIETGGLGEKARKRQLKGPDPDKFYEQLWSANWRFVFKNQLLAWRTILYVLIASLLMFGCGFLYLYIPQWPPRLFFALCTAVSALMIPGWLWFLDQEVVAHTLMRKEKLKRVNFDFFLCSALGIKYILWSILVATPVLLIPAVVGAVLVGAAGLPPWTPAVINGVVSVFLVYPMLGIAMGHMVMPVQAPGFMVWKLFPAMLRAYKPALLWSLLLLFTTLPAQACLATIGALYGPSINTIVRQMEENAAIRRAKDAHEALSPKERAKVKEDPRVSQEFTKVNYFPLIVPGVLWAAACLLLGFPAMYICRVNGQLIYYFRDSFGLIALAKEYKYVAKARKDEDEELKPKTLGQVALESVVVVLICVLIGGVIGMVGGAMTDMGVGNGIANGVYWGAVVASVLARLTLLSAAFQEGTGWGLIVLLVPCGDLFFIIKNWEAGRGPLFITLMAGFVSGICGGLAGVGVVKINGIGISSPVVEQAAPEMVPGAMPGQPGAMPGAMPGALPGAAPGQPGAAPGAPGAIPAQPGAIPGPAGPAAGAPPP